MRHLPRIARWVDVVASRAHDLTPKVSAFARDLGSSCSARFAATIAKHLAARRDKKITAQLNQVYREQPSRLAPALRRTQGRSLPPDEWPSSRRP